MGGSRTNSLHERLPAELRAAVERDLIEQPPGRATYRQVYEHHGLAGHGISLKALERYGGYLRALHRNQWIREVGDAVVGEDLSPRIEGLIRSRLLEVLTTQEEADAGALRQAAMAERALRMTAVREQVERRAAEVHEARMRELRTKLEAAQAAADRMAEKDPAAALARFKEDVRGLYGIRV